MQTNDNDQAPENSPGSDSIGPPEQAADQAAPASPSQARGAFDIRAKRTSGTQGKQTLYFTIAAMILGFLLLVGGGWYLVISHMKSGSAEIDETKVKKDATLDVDQGSDDGMKKAREAKLAADRLAEEQRAREERERKAREDKEKQAPSPGTTDPSSNAGAPATGGSTSSNQPVVLTPRQRKLSASLFVTSQEPSLGAGGNDLAQSNTQPSRPSYLNDAQGGSSGDLGGGARERSSLSNLGGTGFAPAKAYLAPNRKYLVAHNTYTRCALYTEVISTHPGLVDCRLTDPLYSADGSTVIAAAGDKLTGEQRVQVSPGESSVFTAWTEIETQAGVRANINSLGAGPMGASGTEAWIDHHYPQRYGGAVVLSFIQDALKAAANTTQKSSGSGGYTVNNSEQNVESMANKALDSTINIPDTAHVLPGTVITVIFARDVDFSPVFENR
ncbi:TrbI/VirB10 family protein [Pseudomonas sp. hsmgli-8]|uniref:TrbI/VirB10 family protein n=1 Tax=Pseudomonas quercus TaxID=2722792 RepID=A0ABX0YNN0_9PSED|nr:TrbI/VirB10 family protein [Pseudomonas quercus]NJP03488.1 TrbI/VirB10 family protein [Pseudomonas quercus]